MVKEIKESDLCKSFIRQVKTRQCYNYYGTPFEILHIANEHKATNNRLKDIMYLKHLVAMGLLPGAADYFILYKPGKIASIEFKRNKASKLTENQKKFKARCVDLGIPYLCTYDIDEALDFMKDLLC
jgi:hypothetical protein